MSGHICHFAWVARMSDSVLCLCHTKCLIRAHSQVQHSNSSLSSTKRWVTLTPWTFSFNYHTWKSYFVLCTLHWGKLCVVLGSKQHVTNKNPFSVKKERRSKATQTHEEKNAHISSGHMYVLSCKLCIEPVYYNPSASFHHSNASTSPLPPSAFSMLLW